jgi:DNA-directed RNA polymerase subunit RPC12/RpoP
MDIIFNCPKCEQELAVDSSGAGSEINCPACGEKIVIPANKQSPAAPPAAHHSPAASVPHDAAHPVNPIATSAAAKVEMHLKVPVSDKPAASLIQKPSVPLDVAAKESDRKMRVKTIRHTDCIEVGHDKFDEFVTNFLQKVGETNVVSISPLTYTHLDIGTQKIMTEYAVMIVYKG